MMRVQGKVISTENCAATIRPELGKHLVSTSPADASSHMNILLKPHQYGEAALHIHRVWQSAMVQRKSHAPFLSSLMPSSPA